MRGFLRPDLRLNLHNQFVKYLQYIHISKGVLMKALCKFHQVSGIQEALS